MRKRVAGIVLAAGEGRRMGKLKQSLPVRGKSMLETVVDKALASSLHRVVVVLGYHADRLAPLLSNRPVTVVINRDYREGQASSLKAGLRELTPESDAALFLLGDQPLVSSETLDGILVAYQRMNAPIIAPIYGGKRGNPVLLGRELFPLVEDLKGDTGARGILAGHRDMLFSLPVADPKILFDVDTEEDYRCLLEIEQDEDRLRETNY